jgi:surface polysaccharide O-acyltransferase-like enzyme
MAKKCGEHLLTFVDVNLYGNAMNQNPAMQKREFALDLLRVMACFMVVWQHVTECYYINPDMTVPTHDEMPLIGWMNSMTPIEVPLFVMISGYFLLPLKMNVTDFFKRRFPALTLKITARLIKFSVNIVKPLCSYHF